MKKLLLLLLFFSLMTCSESFSQNQKFEQEAYIMYNDAISAYRMRRFTYAKTKLQELIKKYENDGYSEIARVHLAQMYKETKEYDKAIELYKEIIQRRAGLNEAQMAKKDLAELYLSIQRYKDGTEFLEALRKEEPNNVEYSVLLADFYLQTARGDEAWLLLQNVLETHGSYQAFKKLLELSIRTGEVEKLINTIESRKVRYSENRYIDFITDCYIAQKDSKKAIKALMEYEKINIDGSMLQKLTGLLFQEKMYETSIEYLNKILDINPEDWPTLRRLGVVYFKLDKKDKAIETWARPFKGKNIFGRESLMNYVSVLIEHQFYDEAITAIEDYRKRTYDVSAFAVEKANILYSTGKKSEAMEEYLLTFVGGTYLNDTFEKLYEEQSADFSLGKRLSELYRTKGNRAVVQALFEYHFRQGQKDDSQIIADIVNEAGGALDDLFYQRFRQDASTNASVSFYFDLISKVIQLRKNTSLELKLATEAIKMAYEHKNYGKKLYNLAKAVAEKDLKTDLEMSANLNLKVAQYALYELYDINDAKKYLDSILKSQFLILYSKIAVEAALIDADVKIFEEKYDEAQKALKESLSLIEESSDDVIIESDNLINHALKEAKLALHKENYQEALEILKSTVENSPESKYANDSLKMAMDITRLSVGEGFSMLKHYYKAERLKYTKGPLSAIEEL
ncbi:MAG: tetratricopeptide repeat protein, partial [Candidatus Riflebacteria bacterium]|nr:tetratricopeptide repeat protein [Candidatus Riflebacteria bacterium]